jgi:lipopolysaccharide transport system ATP-binding protein
VALRDVLAEKAAGLFRRKTADTPERESFWALKDISFDIQQGDAVGIIGRNGAGKSTLLKLLSRITAPTTGRIEIEGRIASLLEVGTGFHPELTGRENIYLNGAILGMRRTEIKRRFDEIVAFAEVERFLDTPVKHFSSGMYVRLAFAVAAHLEPEVLIVDEVLAVGDIQFQRKCLTKMEDVSGKEGRTVIFVSHNMDLISKLCTKALLLQGGHAGVLEPVDVVTRAYLEQANAPTTEYRAASPTRPLQSITVDQNALMEGKLVLHIRYRFAEAEAQPCFGMVIYTEGGSPVTGSNTQYHPPVDLPSFAKEGEATVTYDYLPLWPGRYSVSFWLSMVDHVQDALTFEFISKDTPLNAPNPKHIGAIHIPAKWTFRH